MTSAPLSGECRELDNTHTETQYTDMYRISPNINGGTVSSARINTHTHNYPIHCICYIIRSTMLSYFVTESIRIRSFVLFCAPIRIYCLYNGLYKYFVCRKQPGTRIHVTQYIYNSSSLIGLINWRFLLYVFFSSHYYYEIDYFVRSFLCALGKCSSVIHD